MARVEDEDRPETLEDQVDSLRQKLEALSEYLTGEAYKEDENHPDVIGRIRAKVGHCMAAAVEIEKHIRTLT